MCVRVCVCTRLVKLMRRSVSSMKFHFFNYLETHAARKYEASKPNMKMNNKICTHERSGWSGQQIWNFYLVDVTFCSNAKCVSVVRDIRLVSWPSFRHAPRLPLIERTISIRQINGRTNAVLTILMYFFWCELWSRMRQPSMISLKVTLCVSFSFNGCSYANEWWSDAAFIIDLCRLIDFFFLLSSA